MYGRNITLQKRATEELLKSKESVEQEVIKRTKELNEKLKELELFRQSVISAELELKRLEDENAALVDENLKLKQMLNNKRA